MAPCSQALLGLTERSPSLTPPGLGLGKFQPQVTCSEKWSFTSNDLFPPIIPILEHLSLVDDAVLDIRSAAPPPTSLSSIPPFFF